MMKKAMFFLSLAALFYSCSNSTKIRSQNNNAYMIPDSLRTPQQKAELVKLGGVLAKNIVVENNHLVFKMNQKEYKKTGMPKQYYGIIQKELETNNRYIDSLHLDANELVKNSKFFQKPGLN